ncbi:MAG: hypothetical protein WCB27_23285 [Thermoguttaceae bacterium]
MCGFHKVVPQQLPETAMPITPHLVEQTASFLQNSPATPKEKLVIGGKLFRAAMISSKDWTPELLNRAVAAYRVFLRGSSVKKTVEQMDEKDVSRCLAQFTKDVTQLATDIEYARSQQPRPRKS